MEPSADSAAPPEQDAAGKPAGRPRRDDWQEPFLEAYALLGIEAEAARRARVSVDTVARERARDPGFLERFQEARVAANGVIERYLHERATTGQTTTKTTTVTDKEGGTTTTVVVTRYISTAALLALARARMPEKYGAPGRLELTGAHGGPIVTEERRVDDAVEQFDAEVVRLADRRGAAAATG